MSYNKEKTENYVLLGGINCKVSAYNNDMKEFRDLSNVNGQVPGALTTRFGTSLYAGATITGRILGGVEFERLSGASYMVVAANTNIYTATGAGFAAFRTNLSSTLYDFVTFVDRLFVCNGQDFFKFDGQNSYNFGLPTGVSTWGVTAVVGGGLSGAFLVSWGYVNERGYYGGVNQGITISLNGATFGSINFLGLTNITGYGATAIALYRSQPGGVVQSFATLIPIGTTTFTLDSGAVLGTRIANDDIFFTLAPRYMEIYNNQVFYAGFSNQLSTAWWSRIGEPEGIEPQFNAEFRTNDGDRITGLKSYNSNLLVFKSRSFHRLLGDNPDNFLLQEVSDQYGCLSNRAVVTFQDYCWFLDSKGIVEYNGANIDVVSTKIEPFIQTMNVNAAMDNAVGLHVRDLNEVWFGVPLNGATLNNTILAYDYIGKAWYKYEGVDISSLWLGRGELEKKSPLFGGYTGSLFAVGQSLNSDYGRTISCAVKVPFFVGQAQTTEAMFRRFYFDVNPITGATFPMRVDLLTNYSASIQTTRTMYANPFQSRIDFGLPGRSIAANIYWASASFKIQLNGYTFVDRFQRDV